VKLQGLIFDIDGTLIDSNDLHVQCWIEAFDSFGKRLEYGVVRHQIGKGGDLLEATTSKHDAEFSKPSPEIFRAALDRIGTDDALTFTVGDTPYDILASHRCALPVVAVLSGGFERELLTKAEFLFEDVEELGRRIEEIDAYFTE